MDAERQLSWSYRWEDSLNALPEVADPPLPRRILQEVRRLVDGGTSSPVIHVRGEMGIGKTELGRLLKEQVPLELAQMLVIEAEDLESPTEFALKVNTLSATKVPLVVMARPVTMDIAGLSLMTLPDATVTIATFRPESAIYDRCLKEVAKSRGLPLESHERLGQMCRRLPEVMQTPFFFGEIAEALLDYNVQTAGKSALEILGSALAKRLGPRGFKESLATAIARPGVHSTTIQGIIDRGRFIHDGYRNLLLAIAVTAGEITVVELLKSPNAVPAVRILLTHVLSDTGQPDDLNPGILAQIANFLKSKADGTVPYAVYLRAFLATAMDATQGDGKTYSRDVQNLCLRIIADQRYQATGHGADSGTLDTLRSTYLWHDVSDGLSLVGDPRLPVGEASVAAATDPYYTYIDLTDVEIGASGYVSRLDNAKPVLPYARTKVQVGPLWVANFLCTANQFGEFWRDPDRQSFFQGTGQLWVNRDMALRSAIADSFLLTATRNFWKEMQEHNRVRDVQFASGLRSVLEIAKARATGELRVSLWDSAQSDSRFSSPGKPVVGVNWWEARAFAAWWQETKLAGFPKGSTVDLLTDWEWEAIRRKVYVSDATPEAKQHLNSRSFPAHLRSVDHQLGHLERVVTRTSPLQPLHVGLFPAPNGSGPYDLVGNVWEWTRSKVFGSIRFDPNADPNIFGGTVWDDVSPAAEQSPTSPGRDDVGPDGDLTYRAVRGASFFSVDPDAAWLPAYRLCDPPYASYFDLGFRVAVYPPAKRENG